MSKKLEITHPDIMVSEVGNIYEFTKTNTSKTKPAEVEKFRDKKIVKWGKDNLAPYHNRQILADNDIKQPIINTLIDIDSGVRLFLYEEKVGEKGKIEVVPVLDDELSDWMEDWDIVEQYREVVTDYHEFGNNWVEGIMSKDKSKVVSLLDLDATDCRLKRLDKRADSELLYLADWKYNQLQKEKIEEVPLLNIRNPLSTIRKYKKWAFHVKKRISGQPYYSLEDWHGTKKWVEIANLIPKFHLAGLKNGYNLRYHIKIPASYFEKYASDEKKLQEAKDAVKKMVDEALGGAEQSGKSLYSIINDKIPGSTTEWKIEKIETDLKDDSYIKLHDHASKVHARGHNLHPILANIETTGNLGSGSEILNLLNFHRAYKTARIRSICLKPFVFVKNYNFPDKRKIKIGVEDIEFTTLDKNPSGKEKAATNHG